MAIPRKTPKQIGSVPVVEEANREVPPTTLMDALDEYIRKDDGKKEPKSYVVPGRPAIALTFDLNIEYEEYEAWTRRARKSKKSDEVNFLVLANIIISNQNIGMTFNGNEAVSEVDGQPLTVKHHDLHKMLKVPTGAVNMCIKALFGNDADILRTMRRVSADAGYTVDGDDIEEEGSPLDD